jgi:prepilin-type N-terminal cleavage/methylation domain-containing protein
MEISMIQPRYIAGFTLIEMLVSLALFTIIATVTVGTLLVLIAGNSRVTGEQEVLTTLSFALDSMTREIRTGSEYFCGNANSVISASVVSSSTDEQSCSIPNFGLSFRESGQSISEGDDNNRIAYYFKNKMIYRRVGDKTETPLIGNEISVLDARFVVTGTPPLRNSSDKQQPTVTIFITAQASSSELTKPFTLQTTVVQRALDI